MKAGHLVNDELIDIFYNHETEEVVELSARRIDTRNTHGTGCTLSSAIAAYVARGCNIADAIFNAKEFVTEAIRHGADIRIGHGFGPVNHGFDPQKMLIHELR